MERKRLIRWTDVFAILGIILIAGWAPAYLAQSPATRDALSDGTFTVPPARIGDRVVYGLVAQWEDEEPVAVGPIAEVAFRAPRPDEAPYRSWIVEEWTWAAHHSDLGFAEYVVAPHVSRTFYDDEGNKVWTESDSVRSFPHEDGYMEYGVNWQKDGEEHWTTRGTHPDHPASVRTVASGTEVRRSQDWSDLLGTRTGHAPMYADHVADHPLGPLFGASVRSPFDRVADDLKAFTGGGSDFYMEKTAGMHTLRARLAGFHGASLLLQEDFKTVVPPEEWHWYRPDIPVVAGAHVEVADSDGSRIYSLDIVPLEIETGSGRGLTPSPYDRAGWSAVAGQRDPAIERRPLGTVIQDTRPLVRDVSLADVWSALAEGPSTIRAMLAQGHMVGLTYFETGSEVRSAADTGVALPLQSAESERVFHSDWLVAVAGENGVARVAHLAMQDARGDGIVSVRVRDACRGIERPLKAWPTQIACGEVDPELVRKDREVVSVQGIVERIRASDPAMDDTQRCIEDGPSTGASPCQFAWLPVFVCDTTRFGPCEGSPLLVDREHAFDSRYPVVDHGLPFDGYARWESKTPTSGRFDLGTGLPLEHVSEEVRPVEQTVRPTAATASEPVYYDKVTSTTVATGGLLLILLSLVIRAFMWATGGGVGPVLAAGYARITKQAALSHERRDQIVRALTHDPGLTVTDLSRRLGIPRTPTLHHLETLRGTGHLTYVQNGRRRHWFVVEEDAPETRLRLVMEHDPVASRFLQVVRDAPALTLSEIAARMGRSKYAVSRTGSRLEGMGLVVKQKVGRTVRFHPAGEPSPAAQHEPVESDGVVA